jgi:hypothetical protein
MDGHFYVFAPYYVRACYLEGNITDNSTGNPLIGATVKILTTPKTAQSNSSGDYKTGYPTAGTFDVEVSQPGYITKTVTGVVLSNGNVTILDVQLDPLSLTINVLDAAGNGVPSALVKVQNTTTDLQFTTDANGSLVVNNIASGNYNITGGKWGYRSGCINVTVGTLGVYDVYIDDGIYDDFTFDFGWSTTSTATAGAWVREEPIGTIFTGTQANPETDAANDCSDHCFITGNGGGSANNDDVDDGTVTLTSPVIDLSGYTDPYFNYQRWFFEQFSSNPASDDTLFISISNGVNTAIVETVYGTSPGNSSWVSNAVRVLDYMPATSNMTFQVLVSDKPFSGNPLEAGLDKFEVSEGPLGIATANMQHNINVYPNPFNDYIEVQLPEGLAGSDAEIQITDISGRQVAAYKVSLAGKITVSTASLNNGIYLLQVSTADVIFAPQKIVRLR